MKAMLGRAKRSYLARLGVFLIITALITGIPVYQGVAGDDNHPSQNLEIRTWYDLNAIRDNLDGNHMLMNDLDSTTAGYTELASPTANGGKGWEPIGYAVSVVSCGGAYPAMYGLKGTFDGQGHEIRDLFINRPDETVVGLARYLNDGGVMSNIGVVNVTVVGHGAVGTLLANNIGGTVTNCYSIGNVTGNSYIGGLVGSNEQGSIGNCYSTGGVAGTFGVGGLVGMQYDGCTIANSYSNCSVNGPLDPDAVLSGAIGGLVGDNYATVSSSFWDTETSGQSTSDGGTGKNTTEMKDIITFSEAGWNIITVSLNETNPAYIWNIVNNVTYPFLSCQA